MYSYCILTGPLMQPFSGEKCRKSTSPSQFRRTGALGPQGAILPMVPDRRRLPTEHLPAVPLRAARPKLALDWLCSIAATTPACQRKFLSALRLRSRSPRQIGFVLPNGIAEIDAPSDLLGSARVFEFVGRPPRCSIDNQPSVAANSKLSTQ